MARFVTVRMITSNVQRPTSNVQRPKVHRPTSNVQRPTSTVKFQRVQRLQRVQRVQRPISQRSTCNLKRSESDLQRRTADQPNGRTAERPIVQRPASNVQRPPCNVLLRGPTSNGRASNVQWFNGPTVQRSSVSIASQEQASRVKRRTKKASASWRRRSRGTFQLNKDKMQIKETSIGAPPCLHTPLRSTNSREKHSQ